MSKRKSKFLAAAMCAAVMTGIYATPTTALAMTFDTSGTIISSEAGEPLIIKTGSNYLATSGITINDLQIKTTSEGNTLNVQGVMFGSTSINAQTKNIVTTGNVQAAHFTDGSDSFTAAEARATIDRTAKFNDDGTELTNMTTVGATTVNAETLGLGENTLAATELGNIKATITGDKTVNASGGLTLGGEGHSIDLNGAATVASLDAGDGDIKTTGNFTDGTNSFTAAQVATMGTNVTALQNKTQHFNDDGSTLTGMTTVGATNVNATTFTAGTNTTLTDGTLDLGGNELTNARLGNINNTITGDKTVDASGGLTLGSTNVVTTGTVQGGTLTDGTASLTAGALTGLASINTDVVFGVDAGGATVTINSGDANQVVINQAGIRVGTSSAYINTDGFSVGTPDTSRNKLTSTGLDATALRVGTVGTEFTVGANGNTAVGGTLDVTGVAHMANNLTVDGTFTAGATNVTHQIGNVTINNNAIDHVGDDQQTLVVEGVTFQNGKVTTGAIVLDDNDGSIQATSATIGGITIANNTISAITDIVAPTVQGTTSVIVGTDTGATTLTSTTAGLNIAAPNNTVDFGDTVISGNVLTGTDAGGLVVEGVTLKDGTGVFTSTGSTTTIDGTGLNVTGTGANAGNGMQINVATGAATFTSNEAGVGGTTTIQGNTVNTGKLNADTITTDLLRTDRLQLGNGDDYNIAISADGSASFADGRVAVAANGTTTFGTETTNRTTIQNGRIDIVQHDALNNHNTTTFSSAQNRMELERVNDSYTQTATATGNVSTVTDGVITATSEFKANSVKSEITTNGDADGPKATQNLTVTDATTTITDGTNTTTVTTDADSFSVAGATGNGMSIDTTTGVTTFTGHSDTYGSGTQATTVIDGNTITTGRLTTDELVITGSGEAAGTGTGSIVLAGDGSIKSNVTDADNNTTFETTANGVTTEVTDGTTKTNVATGAGGSTTTLTDVQNEDAELGTRALTTDGITDRFTNGTTVGGRTIGQDDPDDDFAITDVVTTADTTDDPDTGSAREMTVDSITEGVIDDTNFAERETVAGRISDRVGANDADDDDTNDITAGNTAVVAQDGSLVSSMGVYEGTGRDSLQAGVTVKTDEDGDNAAVETKAGDYTTTLDNNGLKVTTDTAATEPADSTSTLITSGDVNIKTADYDIYLSDIGEVTDMDEELRDRVGEERPTVVEGLNAEAAIRREEVARLDGRIDKTEARLDRVGAMAAAAASLKSMGYDPAAPTEFALSVGTYSGSTAIAAGLFHYPNRDFMLNISYTQSGKERMGGLGATWKFGRKNPDKLLDEAVAERQLKVATAKEKAEAAAKLAEDARQKAAYAAKQAELAKIEAATATRDAQKAYEAKQALDEYKARQQ